MELYPTDIIIHIINIVVLFLLLRAILYKPIKKFMSARTAKIEGQLADAEKASEDAAKEKEQLDKRLANAENEAHEIIVAGEEKSAAAASKIIADAKAKSDKIVKKAIEDSEKEKQEALDGMRGEITDLSVEIAGRILKREISKKDNSKLIDEFFSEMKKS